MAGWFIGGLCWDAHVILSRTLVLPARTLTGGCYVVFSHAYGAKHGHAALIVRRQRRLSMCC